MLFKFVHRTEIEYDDTITESVMELRVMPRNEPQQRRRSFHLAVGPPTTPTRYTDWLGNAVHALAFNTPHRRVLVEATSVVELRRERVDLATLNVPYTPAPRGSGPLVDFLGFGGPVLDTPLLKPHLDAVHAEPGEPVGAVARRVMDHIHATFRYEAGVTTSASPITDLLEGGRGVCQDFTHLALALFRKLRLPARYVSGLVHPLRDDFRGVTQTHAWIELLLDGPQDRWLALDPTNNHVVGSHYVKIAVGRDFRDVPPNKGVYRGDARQTTRASVHSEKLATLPEDEIAPPTVLDVGPAEERPPLPELAYQQAQQQQ